MKTKVSSAAAPHIRVALPLRSHTILGTCEAIGEDFHFNPNWLRIPLAASVIVSPLYAFVVYFALGAVVLTSRLMFPISDQAWLSGDEAQSSNVANSEVEDRLAA